MVCLRNILAVIAASLSSFAGGNVLAWGTPELPKLISDNSPLGRPITSLEVSLITSLYLLGSTIGYIFTGLTTNKLGRRKSLLFSAIPLSIGWIFLYFIKSIELLCIDRFFLGFVYSVPYMASMVYITEITQAENRGKLFILVVFMLEFGQLFTVVLGNYISYGNLALVCSSIPLLYFFGLLPFPESPYFFLRNGDYDSAEQSLKKFRTNSVSKELAEIDFSVKEDMKNSISVKELMFGKEYRRELLIVMGLKTLYQFSGTHAIQNYMGIIFQAASTGLDTITSTIICSSVTIPSMSISIYVIDKFGRKPLYYVSTIGCTVALLMEFTYFLLQDTFNQNMDKLAWLPLTGIFLFYIFRSLGVTTLSQLIMSELFPTNVKGAAISFQLFYSGLLSFLVTFGFPLLNEFWGIAYSFLLFAFCCFMGFILILLFVPETKGKTLAEIQNEIRKNNSKSDDCVKT